MIAVSFALESESSEFVRLLRDPRKDRDAHSITGVLGQRNVVVLHTGVGELVARGRIGKFLKSFTPQILISAGFAGGLTDSCQPGDVIIAKNFSAAQLYAAAKQLLPTASIATLKTMPAIVHSSSSRSELAHVHGADAVDMETDFIAQACAATAIPMLSLRVISDTRRHPFPAPPDVLFDVQHQRTNLAGVVFYIGTHPTALPQFIRFARQIKLARAALTDAVASVVNSDRFS